MAKDPAFLFYASDFLTGTMFFSNEQAGKYIRLLCSQHQHGGFIDKNSFNGLVGDDKMLRAKFVETEHGFYNIRLSEEMEGRAKKSSNISDAAKETWKKRKENTIVIQSYKKPKAKVIQPEDENEIENKDIIKEKVKNKKNEKLEMPLLDTFLNYVCENYSGDFKEINDSAILKYKSWVENDWKDGNGIKIKNWKSKILNTIPHLKLKNDGRKNGTKEPEPKIGRIPVSSIERFINTKSVPDDYEPGDFDGIRISPKF